MLQIYVSTANFLSTELRKKIEKKISAKFSKEKLEFNYLLDENLIAGIRISVNGQLYDGSLKAKLEKIADSLNIN